MSDDPNFNAGSWPGCRGDCQRGQRPCLSPEECAPDGPPFTRAGCLIVLALSILCWAGVGALIWFAMGIGL